jgi:hypothetical protein
VAQAGQSFAASDLQMAESCRTMLAHAGRTRDLHALALENDRLRDEVRARLTASLARRTAAPEWTVEGNAARHRPRSDRRQRRHHGVQLRTAPWGVLPVRCDGRDARWRRRGARGGRRLDDESAAVAGDLLRATDVPARLVRKHHNTGLADARNVGIELARGDFVLTLDADNWIYPPCLRVLAQTIRQNDGRRGLPDPPPLRGALRARRGLLGLYPWNARASWCAAPTSTRWRCSGATRSAPSAATPRSSSTTGGSAWEITTSG